VRVAQKQSHPLTRSPLNEVAPKLAAIISKMSLDDIAALLSGNRASSGASPQAAAAPSSSSSHSLGNLDAIARAVLALPDSKHRLREVERAVVAHALLMTKGNVSAAARLLGVERKALERRVDRHKIAVRRG
jgi:DNA-binding NtrC family response regulator